MNIMKIKTTLEGMQRLTTNLCEQGYKLKISGNHGCILMLHDNGLIMKIFVFFK